MTDQLEALRGSVERLRRIVEPLTSEQLRASAYPTEWCIADVLSHIGSGAVIMGLRLDATVEGRELPDDVAQPIWDEWNAKSPEAKAADGLAADRTVLDQFDALSADQKAGLSFSVGPIQLDFTTFLGLRLNEHALHTWDIEVALDPSATVPTDAARFVVDQLGMLVQFAGRPDLELPAEALIRLVYGRLDVDHTPLVRGDADLDELRRAFPGV